MPSKKKLKDYALVLWDLVPHQANYQIFLSKEIMLIKVK